MAVSQVYTAVTGDTITAARWNNEFSNIYSNGTDVAFPLTKAVAGGGYAFTAHGSTTMSSGAPHTMTAGTAYWAKGADIASASTVTLGADGNYYDITGTTTITAFAMTQAGQVFMTQFDGALTLTHNATSFALPGAANITTAAGDRAIWIAESTANARCLVFTKTDGTAIVGGSASTTTQVLTGTDTTTRVTPDALAALWEEGSDVASAGTISLGEGGFFDVTGTTTITDIDFATDKAGRWAWVRFTAALTLTHNSTTLILPTGANITTVADDTALFVSEGSDNVRCYVYHRKSGAPLVAGTVTTLGTEVASTSGTAIDFTGIPAATRSITIMFVGTSTNGTSNIMIQLGDAGGFETTGYSSTCSTDTGGTRAPSTAGFLITASIAAAEAFSGHCRLALEDSSDFTWVASSNLASTAGTSYMMDGAGSKALSAELTQVRLTMVNGTDAFDLGAVNISYHS